ncbi:TolC family protein [Granulicella arctica]|uniref:Outer membrane protein TolC n=1 Tax=Granulicella arctica TaxID=940613 RepID=A0A7Y9PHJ7_9BACT|nr:TolC family protein [Granulicella arctica]NYF79875.1 outer membrane protein TolC [Granulicella arctica]
MPFLLRLSIVVCALALACMSARAQISFTTAIDLSLRYSPRVQMAQADVNKARAALSEARDVYIPSVTAGSGLGYSYGFPLGQPSIYNVGAQSLVLNFSQHDYIRAARSGLESANYALMDARQAIAEDAAITYLALDHDLQREAALHEEGDDAARLVSIVQDRLDAGQDTGIELTTAKLTKAQIRLSVLRDEDETESDRAHLARLTGLPEEGLATVSSSIPAIASKTLLIPGAETASSPGVLAAYANARAKQEQAFGDSRYELRPQIAFGAQYERFATFNNYSAYYRNFQQNNAAIAVQISLPILDIGHRAKARESAAEAVHALREADLQRDQFLDGKLKLEHASAELGARAEVAELDQQLAQQQLEAMTIQLQEGTGNTSGRQMSPKDEQNARISERQKFLSVLDTTLQMRQAQINLLRQTGQLEPWLKSLISGLAASKRP